MNFKSLTEYYRRKSKENLPDLVEEFKNLTLNFKRAESSYSKDPNAMLRMLYSYVIIICDPDYYRDFIESIQINVDSEYYFSFDSFEATITRKLLIEHSKKDSNVLVSVVKLAAALYGLSDVPLDKIPYNAFEYWPN